MRLLADPVYAQHERGEGAAVEGHFEDLLIGDERRDGGALVLHQGGGGRLDGFLDVADFEREVGSHGCRGAEHDAGLHELLKSRGLGGDGVGAGGNRCGDVLAAVVGCGGARETGGLIGQNDGGIGNDGAVGVADSTDDGAAFGLGEKGGSGGGQDDEGDDGGSGHGVSALAPPIILWFAIRPCDLRDSRHLTVLLLGVGRQEDPQRIDAERCSKRHIEEVEEGQDNRESAGPGLPF